MDSGRIKQWGVLTAFHQVLKLIHTSEHWQMWCVIKKVQFYQIRRIFHRNKQVSCCHSYRDEEKHSLELINLHWHTIRFRFLPLWWCRETGSLLTVGLFAFTISAMCIDPKISQSATDASAGDVKNVQRATWVLLFNVFNLVRKYRQHPHSIGVDELLPLFSTSFIRYKRGCEIECYLTRLSH